MLAMIFPLNIEINYRSSGRLRTYPLMVERIEHTEYARCHSSQTDQKRTDITRHVSLLLAHYAAPFDGKTVLFQRQHDRTGKNKPYHHDPCQEHPYRQPSTQLTGLRALPCLGTHPKTTAQQQYPAQKQDHSSKNKHNIPLSFARQQGLHQTCRSFPNGSPIPNRRGNWRNGLLSLPVIPA